MLRRSMVRALALWARQPARAARTGRAVRQGASGPSPGFRPVRAGEKAV